MTKENYTQYSNQELVHVVLALNKRADILNRYLYNNYPELLQEIILRTHFLDDGYYQNKPVPVLARLYCLEHNIKEHPRCQNPNCPGHNLVGWHGKMKSFLKHCSCKCSAQDPHTDKLKRQTNLERRGVEYTVQSKEVRDTIIHSRESIERFKKTCTERHGGVGFQSPMIWQKYQDKLIEHFGVSTPMLSDEIKQKIKQTNLDKRGVENVSQDINVKTKKEQTNLKRRGVKYPTQSQEVKDKYKMRCRTNWGVDNYSQTDEFAKKCHKRYTNPKYPEMSWATSWEFKVYDFLTENSIPFEYQPKIAIPFYCEGTRHYYHPDFLVNGRIYEVKGDNFFRINEETGKEEMYLTWQGDLSDEEYEWKCKVMEAKYQCMIANNVRILRQNDVFNLSIDMFSLHN